MKRLLLILIILLFPLTLHAEEWMEARMSMGVVGGGVAAGGPTVLLNEGWEGCTANVAPTSCTSGITWNINDAPQPFTVKTTGTPHGGTQHLLDYSDGTASKAVSATFATTTSAVTMELWIKSADVTVDMFPQIRLQNAAGAECSRLVIKDSGWTYLNGGGSWIAIGGTLTNDTWYKAKVVFTPGASATNTIYVDDTGDGIYDHNTADVAAWANCLNVGQIFLYDAAGAANKTSYIDDILITTP